MALWTPAQTTTALWLDAADASSITLESGAVSQWADLSGNDRHATQAISTKRPASGGSLGGLNALSFGGDDVLLTEELFDSTAATATLCIVCSSSAEKIGGLLSTRPTTLNQGWSLRTGSATTALYYHTGFTPTLNMATASGAKLLVVTRDGVSVFAAVDGVAGSVVTTGGYATSAYGYTSIGAEIGGAVNYFTGLMAEVVCLPVAADTTTRQLLEGYLAHKWGMAASLPVGHPYKAAAPEFGGPVGTSLGQLWDLLPSTGERTAQPLVHGWLLLDAVSPSGLAQPWGLRMSRDLVAPWADALVRRSGLVQPWQDAGLLVAPLVARWQDMAALRAELEQPWQVFGSVTVDLAQPWAILGAAAQGLLAQPWDLPGRDTLAAALTQPWSIDAEASLLRYTVEVLADGQPVRISHVNIEGDLGQDVLSCEIHPETEGEYLLCALGAALQITVTSAEATSVFDFVVTAPRIDEQHGQTRYVVEAMSPAVLLGEPWATPIDGEHSGLASAIAASLAAPATLDWQTVDWAIPAATLIASQQTPLALVKQVAAAVGAVVQSEPDGSLRVLPEYPLAVPAWPTASPDQSLTETLDLFTTASTPDIRQGHNKFLVGDQMTSADTLRLEEEALTATTKLVRGYQTPWTGAFSLRHTGGSWVQIEALGIETRQQTETIEIVAGSGRTQYPIVSRDAVTWGQVNLGSVTFSEDGTLSASVAGESLLTLTYTTRCRKWRVRDPNNEQLQLVADL